MELTLAEYCRARRRTTASGADRRSFQTLECSRVRQIALDRLAYIGVLKILVLQRDHVKEIYFGLRS